MPAQPMLFAMYVRTKKTRSPLENQQGTKAQHLTFDLAQLPQRVARRRLFHRQTIHQQQMEQQQENERVQYRPQIHLPLKPHGDPQLALPDLRVRLVFGQPQDLVNLIAATRLLHGEPARPH